MILKKRCKVVIYVNNEKFLLIKIGICINGLAKKLPLDNKESTFLLDLLRL